MLRTSTRSITPLLACMACMACLPALLADVSPFVVGGREASRNQFPQTVSLQTTGHFCGGVIIDQNWVLTAAHCVHDKQARSVSILAGTTDNRSGGVRVRASEIRTHSNWDGGPSRGLVNDVALIKTQTPIPLSNTVRVASLDKSGAKAGEKAVVAGWGMTKSDDTSSGSRTLQFADLTVISNSQCEGVYWDAKILEDQVCATRPGSDDAGACMGDSGGPLFRNGWVVGLASWVGLPCGRHPGVYASVAYHIPWIRQQTGLTNI